MAMRVLGIETSCDETAAAIVQGAVEPSRRILASRVLSQLDEHRPYGGVVPEIAARSHITYLDALIREALAEAKLDFEELDAIAATTGPGLIGGVFVGMMTGKAMAAASRRPFIAVNHLEGHALTVRLTEGEAVASFPYLLLLISGGHCQLVAVEAVSRYHKLGGTLDDAVGEAFDKVAKMMGLPYPGGPQLERCAQDGNPGRFDLPRPLKGRGGCDFSFSGLKTAMRQKIGSAIVASQSPNRLDIQDKADLAASFQEAVAEILLDRCEGAMDQFERRYGRAGPLVVAGGVAANLALRNPLIRLCEQKRTSFLAPPVELCTDNAAMIAWAGLERFRLGMVDSLEAPARPRWPLDQLKGVEA